MPELVDSAAQAVENIRRYQAEIEKSAALVGRMPYVRGWYAVESNDGTWLFAPSKFIGYVGLTAETYVEMSPRAYRPLKDRLDGRMTEPVLERWFEPPMHHADELERALRSFLKTPRFGRTVEPNANARISVLKEAAARTVDAPPAPGSGERIRIDQAICGGRPHIRGTRVRVSDILDMLASGVSRQDILADYPSLKDADLRAALAFGAAASRHRIVHAA